VKTAKELHEGLDMLVARFIIDTGKRLGDTSVMKLIEWSYGQAYKKSSKGDKC